MQSSSLERAVRWQPPPCLPVVTCSGTCGCLPTRFYQPPENSQPQLSASEASGLSAFFFDGHTGPLNDMAATLRHMNVSAERMDVMLMAQAAEHRPYVDVLQLKRRSVLPASVKRRMRDFLRGATFESSDATVLPKCERRRCRDALYSHGLRVEFARRFGAAFEAHIDLVACNFPTWQCALFMHVNVAIIMRFTHRWDHHLQGYYVDPGTSQRPASSWSELHLASAAQRSAALNNSMAASLRWRKMKGKGAEALRAAGLLREMPAEALRTLRDMAARPNVLLAASNPYDAQYLRRAFGVNPAPWPGTARQLLGGVAYTGERTAPLFCCGNAPYNLAIAHVAAAIRNASSQQQASAEHGGGTGTDGALLGAPQRIDFLWPSEVGSARRGYKYTDLAAHPFAVLLPYSVHSYGVVQAYAMGVPLLAPTQYLLAQWHSSLAMLGHKGPGNVPWRRSAERQRVPFDGWAWLAHDQHSWFSTSTVQHADGCAHDPNDGCSAAVNEWLPLAEPYTWPHVGRFDSIVELLAIARDLLRNRTRRLELSAQMKAFFATESERAEGHARIGLRRALQAARLARAAQSTMADAKADIDDVDTEVDTGSMRAARRTHTRLASGKRTKIKRRAKAMDEIPK